MVKIRGHEAGCAQFKGACGRRKLRCIKAVVGLQTKRLELMQAERLHAIFVHTHAHGHA